MSLNIFYKENKYKMTPIYFFRWIRKMIMKFLPECNFVNLSKNRKTKPNFSIDKTYVKKLWSNIEYVRVIIFIFREFLLIFLKVSRSYVQKSQLCLDCDLYVCMRLYKLPILSSPFEPVWNNYRNPAENDYIFPNAPINW